VFLTRRFTTGSAEPLGLYALRGIGCPSGSAPAPDLTAFVPVTLLGSSEAEQSQTGGGHKAASC